MTTLTDQVPHAAVPARRPVLTVTDLTVVYEDRKSVV